MTTQEAIKFFKTCLTVAERTGKATRNTIEAILKAIKALEKQVPKNPEIRIHLNRVPEEESQPHCPNCNEDLEYIIDLNDFRHCPYCGQAIKGFNCRMENN